MQEILVESSYGAIWRESMEGITWYARQRRLPWHIHCVTTEELPLALRQRPAGAITLLLPPQRHLISRLAAAGIPAVNLLRAIHPRIPAVMSDNRLIGRRAADHLHGQGFPNFCFAGVDRIWSHERQLGFATRLAELGRKSLLCPVPLSVASLRGTMPAPARRRLRNWLARLPRPSALFASADFAARALLDAAGPRGAGLAIPEDLAILGVDNDLAICDLAAVPLSSIPQNMRRIGFEAARLLEGLMRRQRRPRGPVIVPPRDVVVRRSTDFIAASNPHVSLALRQIRTRDPATLHIPTLLRDAGISRQWLDRQFRTALGTTPAEEIRRRKLAAARTLLLETHLPIHTIARRSGFTHGENLSRFFKQQLGLSPRAFRQKNSFIE